MAALAAGCAPARPPARDAHIPPFARLPYQRFSREAAVQIALREWRAFGSPVHAREAAPGPDLERAEGLWQRVGEYWWLGLPLGMPEQGWTGKHDAHGRVFPAGDDEHYAWSAAFIDYVMRMAGATGHFPYAPSHSTYINLAREHRPGVALDAEPPERYAPRRGDLICAWRDRHPVRFADLPTGDFFPSHCDIVVGREPGVIDAIGGNVDNAVALTRVPVAADGRLVGPDGRLLDPDIPWFVVLRVLYEE